MHFASYYLFRTVLASMAFALSSLCALSSFAPAPPLSPKIILTTEENELYRLINEYRSSKKLPSIPLSSSLSFVAHQHCIDLADTLKSLTHGWSSCDYDAANADTYTCMWLKPSEMTEYKGYGYECAFAGSSHVTAEEALYGWKGSTPHNEVITNKGMWSGMKWNAIGIGIYKGYSCIWFGEEKDPAGTPAK